MILFGWSAESVTRPARRPARQSMPSSYTTQCTGADRKDKMKSNPLNNSYLKSPCKSLPNYRVRCPLLGLPAENSVCSKCGYRGVGNLRLSPLEMQGMLEAKEIIFYNLKGVRESTKLDTPCAFPGCSEGAMKPTQRLRSGSPYCSKCHDRVRARRQSWAKNYATPDQIEAPIEFLHQPVMSKKQASKMRHNMRGERGWTNENLLRF